MGILLLVLGYDRGGFCYHIAPRSPSSRFCFSFGSSSVHLPIHLGTLGECPLYVLSCYGLREACYLGMSRVFDADWDRTVFCRVCMSHLFPLRLCNLCCKRMDISTYLPLARLCLRCTHRYTKCLVFIGGDFEA